MAQGQKRSLRDEEIIVDLISDNLSDVPEDIYSESDGASDTEGKIKNVPHGSVCVTVTVKLALMRVYCMRGQPTGK
jgi:hypothetical protein